MRRPSRKRAKRRKKRPKARAKAKRRPPSPRKSPPSRRADDGWILSSKLAELLGRKLPDFDVRNFRYKKFVQFVESLQLFETKRQAAEGELVHTIYFRVKA